MTERRFPRRPEHPDFWLLSEVLVSQDAQAEKAAEPFEDMVNRYIDLPSLEYAAEQQASMFVQQRGRQMVYGNAEVRAMLQASFLSAFVFGVRFQALKAQRAQSGPLTSEDEQALRDLPE